MAKNPRKEKSKVRKILEWVFTSFFLLMVAGVAGLRIYQNATNDYSIFGTLYPVVLTDSMETDYMVGDVLVIKELKEDEIAENVHVGSDISFHYNITDPKTKKVINVIMTHRVETVTYFPDASQNKGYHWTFVTHGINKQSKQCGGGDCTDQTQTFYENDLVGVVTGKSGFLTVVNKMTSSVWTLIVLILIPSLYLVVTAVINLVRGLDEIDKEAEVAAIKSSSDGKDVLKDLSDEDRARLKQEMLDEMLEKANKKK